MEPGNVGMRQQQFLAGRAASCPFRRIGMRLLQFPRVKRRASRNEIIGKSLSNQRRELILLRVPTNACLLGA